MINNIHDFKKYAIYFTSGMSILDVTNKEFWALAVQHFDLSLEMVKQYYFEIDIDEFLRKTVYSKEQLLDIADVIVSKSPRFFAHDKEYQSQLNRHAFIQRMDLTPEECLESIEQTPNIWNSPFNFFRWRTLCKLVPLTEAFIEKYVPDTFFLEISYHQKLSHAFIRKYANKLNWHGLVTNQGLLSEDLVRIAIEQNYIDLEILAMHQAIPKDLLIKNIDQIDIYIVLHHQHMTEDLIRLFSNAIDQESCWEDVVETTQLSEQFILEFEDKLCWYDICMHQQLSEKFMEMNWTKVYLPHISMYQKMSLDFIRRHKSELIMCENIKQLIHQGHSLKMLEYRYSLPESIAQIIHEYL